jgi:hypothetical protein
VSLAILACLVCFGLATTASIVSREGVDGLFDRKRKALQGTMPEALPILDRVEERVR